MLPKLFIALMLLLSIIAGASAVDVSEVLQDIDYNPEAGYYTSYWFNADDEFFVSVTGLFHSVFLPVQNILGTWVFVVIWGTLIMGIYLHTQETTLPFVVGIITGSMIAWLLGESGVLVAYLTLGFAGAGILTKALLGRR